MDEALHGELNRARRYQTPVAFLLIDVDGLKAINDEGGHDAGDAAIRAVASAVHGVCRNTDVAGRWGGDEFALIAPGCTARQAMHLAERIREDVRSKQRTGKHALSVSIGVTDDRLARDRSAGALYASADRALYEAKAAGRDRVVLPPSPVRLVQVHARLQR
jgi:diguanylate cyclase (GGDEF)-like protein